MGSTMQITAQANQFEKIATEIDDVFILQKSKFEDDRGIFIKTFNQDAFNNLGLNFTVKESVYSISRRNVLRGCHYQRYPFGHAKLVNVIKGEILDVIVGIGGKFNTRNRGKVFSTILSEDNNRSLYIPDGYAHGFLCLSNEAIVSYTTTSIYSVENDTGVQYNSFGFEWPIKNPIISEKDKNLPKFNDF
jgi:dTDP-4-dehydrorhamnose 3,5-epimerase